MAFTLLFFFFMFFSLITTYSCHTINGMFVFGSSLVDNGNNNFIETRSKADYEPYGIDFPLGPTGRFSNGKNVIDGLGELLQLPSTIPVFKDPATKGRNIVHGVNYASGGSGILDDTGSISGNVISLNQQIMSFEEVTLPDLTAQLGSASSLSKYLFVMGSGGNDYLLNYFLHSFTSKVTIEDFTSNLTESYSTQIQKLYFLGARKSVIISVYPLGCIPAVKNIFPLVHGCVDFLNQATQIFNSHVKLLIDDLKTKLPSSHLVYIDTYQIIMDILRDPITQGFGDTSNSCCELHLLFEGGNGILCKRSGYVCEDRTNYVFFDGLHPTESVNNMIANKSYTSTLKTEVYPINIQQLVEI